MARLHAFGCSHTYGEGITKQDLPPNNKTLPLYPSIHSWAAILANSINFTLINHAIPGSSNHGILNQVKNARFKKGDVAAILFTYYNRSIYYTDDGDCDHINLPDPNKSLSWTKQSKGFYRLYSEYHMEQISLYDIEHTYLYLQSLNIPFIAMFVKPISDTHKSSVIRQMILDADRPIHNVVYSQYKDDQRWGADGDHWSKPVHKRIAKIAEDKLQPLITSL